MPGDFVRMEPQVTLEQFHAFRDDRPSEEKWELIAGVPNMMPPPTLAHQRIAGNIEAMLNIRLAREKPEWRADREVGLLLPDDDQYNPEPDVTVIDTKIEAGQLYAHRFYFVVEVLSAHDKPQMLDLKLAWYRRHEHCLAVLFVAQDCIQATLSSREGIGWREAVLSDPKDMIVLPKIGAIGTLGDAYRHTPLFV
jgi:Uma2 family endonuclease